jgi:hypothetical protein
VVRSGTPFKVVARGTLSRTTACVIAAATVAHLIACESYARSFMTRFDAIPAAIQLEVKPAGHICQDPTTEQ